MPDAAEAPPGAMKWLRLSAAVIVCDQIAKALATAWLAPGEVTAVIPGVNLVLVYNTGAAFSLLATAGGWQRWFLLAIALAVSVFLLAWLRRLEPGEKCAAVGVALLLGGAIGNMIDRAWLGHVIDYMDVYYQSYHWPAFNVADAAITAGAVAVIASMWEK